MNKTEHSRLVSFLIAAALHLLLLFGVVFTFRSAFNVGEAPDVMKLADIREEQPPPSPARISQSADTFAETITETEEYTGSGTGDSPDFLPMHLISQLPKFSETEIRKKLIYPPMAQRAGLEGTVYLELFVDNRGHIRNISVLKEDPPDRGFGDAAVKAFQGLRGSPALANGTEVAVRYRYPVRFALK
jgi:protein TonB